MSIKYEWTGKQEVKCDNCGYEENYSLNYPGELMKRLKEKGWSVTEGKDLCPSCN